MEGMMRNVTGVIAAIAGYLFAHYLINGSLFVH